MKDILRSNRDKVIIQMHKSPDVDALSSAVIMSILSKHLNPSNKVELLMDVNPKDLIKPNIKKVFNRYSSYFDEIRVIENKELVRGNQLLILVDCQYGQNNVIPYDCINVMVFDHHKRTVDPVFEDICVVYSDINPSYCSTTSLLFHYVEDILNTYPELSNLIYNGMYNDTNRFTKPLSPKDTDIKIRLEGGTVNVPRVDKDVLYELNRETFTVEDIKVVSKALNSFSLSKTAKVATVEVPVCDTNLLGHISDILSEIEGNDIVVSYFIDKDICKLSVRSYDKFINAHEVITYLTEGIGNGGGGVNASGGTITLSELREITYKEVADYIEDKLTSIYHYYDKFEYGVDDLESLELKGFNVQKARKTEYIVRLIEKDRLKQLFREICPKVRIITREGLIEVEDTHIAVGVEGEVYPVGEDFFDKYIAVGDYPNDVKDSLKEYASYFTDLEIEIRSVYSDSVVTFNKAQILSELPQYVAVPGTEINVVELKKPCKVVSKWGRNSIRGNIGDFLALYGDDIYVIAKDLFNKTYSRG